MTTPQQIQARADQLLQPISDGAPTGQNAAYEPQFESLRAEVGKLDSPAAGDVDWDRVAAEGQQLLRGLSKDLLVASYTTYALFQTEKLPGLAVGLGVIDGMLDKYWEDCFPPAKRMRGRANALDWLIARLENALAQLSITPGDRPALDLVVAGYQQLSSRARERMSDAAPGMGGVREVLQRMDMKIPKATPSAAPSATPADATPAPAPANGASPPTPSPSPAPAANAEPPAAASAAPAPAPAPSPPPPATDPLADVFAAAQRWLEPIAANNHTGDDARYEPTYEEARIEVAKLESARAHEVDWEKVGANSDAILRTKAKDVLMASYFARARLESKGIEGLTVGLAVVGGLFDAFPEGRWPTRERGQGNAIAWLVGQLELALGTMKATPADRESLDKLGKVLKKASGSMRERLGEHAPSTRPVEEKLQRMLLSIPKPQPKPEPKPEPRPAAAPTPTPAAAPTPNPGNAPSVSAPLPTATADVGSAEEVTKYLLDTGRGMVKVAAILRRSQLSSPAAYRLMRLGLYLHLDAPPPSGPGGKTQIPPMPPQRRKPLELMEANEKWAALIEETESGLGQFRFLLDLHFLSARSLAGLGAEYEPARRALMAEVSSLLQRMPSLPELVASDGTPLASDETRAWIAREVMAAGEGGGGPSAGSSTDDPGEDLKKAKALMSGNKGAEALKLAKDAIADAGHPRLKFVRRLALADACLAADQAQLARAMFGALERQLRDEGLTQWEPDLAGRCLEGLIRAIRATIKKGAKPDDSAQEAFERLAAVDPERAAKLATG